MLTPGPKHPQAMCRSFAIAEAVFAAEFLVDGCEEVKRAVHLCTREIEWLPYRMV